MDAVRQALADELGEDGIRKLAQRYAEAYEGCHDGAELDAYIEEICADAYAGMMDRLPEEKARIVQQAAQRRLEAQSAERSGKTRGPPEKYSMVGYGSNGLKTYKSDFSSDMTATEKQEYLYSLIKSVWSKKPLQLTILQDGKERSISARFDGESNGQEFAGKMAFGNRRGTRTERLISLNLADDIWEIASESTYDASKGGIKETLAHDGSERWHYFVNAINYVDKQQPSRNGVYDFNLDVMEREDGNFVYTFALKKEETTPPGLSLPGLTATMPPTLTLLIPVYAARSRKVKKNFLQRRMWRNLTPAQRGRRLSRWTASRRRRRTICAGCTGRRQRLQRLCRRLHGLRLCRFPRAAP